MKKTRFVNLAVLLFLSLHSPLNVWADGPAISLRKGDVVAFLGGTNTVNLQRNGCFEAILTIAFASAEPKFRDFAWEGDTVYEQGTVIERWRRDKFGNLADQLNENHVTVVVAQFGQNEAIHGKDRLDEFSHAYGSLLDAIESADRRVILVSPIPYERVNAPLPDLSDRNGDLALYVKVIAQLAKQHDCTFVNLFARLLNRTGDKLTKNGIHVTPSSQEVVAQMIAQQLHLSTEAIPNSLQIAITAKHQLWLDYWRPANWKCLYGDDGERHFGEATGGGLTLREEWNLRPGLIQQQEQAIWSLAKQALEARQ